MDSTRIHIPNELFAPAESSHFAGDYSLPTLTAGPDTYTFAEPIHWSLDITNTGDAFLVTGTAEGKATVACARCLEDVEEPFVGDIEGYFLISDEQITPDEMEGDEFDILPANHEIDLGPLIEAALLLEVPLIPLCQEDCKGLCPQCGANLNEGPCGCEAPVEEVSPDNPFAVLKNLNLSE